MIKKLLFSLLLLSTPLVAKQQVSTEKEFIEKLQQLIETSNSDSGLPWPGFQLSRPIVVSFKNGHVYSLELQHPDSHWQQLSKNVGYSPNDHWNVAQIPFSPYHRLGDEQVMVFHIPEPDNRGLFTIVHESFHLHQFAHFPPPELSGGYHDHLNVGNLALLELEEATLADFLEGDLEGIKDFVAVNQTRHALITRPSIEWEHHQQLMEGLADYAAYRLFDATDLAWADQPIDALTQPISSPCDYAIKWRHYAVGATLGMVLDHLQTARWREDTESTGKSPGEWLRETVALTFHDIQERLAIAIIRHHHAENEEIVAKSVDKYTTEVHINMVAHAQGPGKIIRLGSLPGQGGAGGGKNAKTYTLPEGGTLAIRDTSTSFSNDQTWKLSLVNVAHLLNLPGSIREFRFDDATEVRIDGRKLRLDILAMAPTTIHFRDLHLSGRHGEFTSSGNRGTLKVDAHGIVSIRFS